jgi:hypothetical protein
MMSSLPKGLIGLVKKPVALCFPAVPDIIN